MAATCPRMSSRMLYAAVSLVLTLGARAEAEVTLRLSQPTYEPGEVVSFTLTNGSRHVITLPYSLGWWLITDWQGALVGGCEVLPLELPLSPGAFLNDEWNQQNCWDESQVPHGRYRLEVSYWSECCPGQFFAVFVYFDIRPVPVLPTSWGRVKAVFSGR